MAYSVPSFISKDRQETGTKIISESGALLFNLSVISLVAVLALAGGLFLYKRSAETNLAQWTKQVEADEAELKPDRLVELNNLLNSITITGELLSGHAMASNILSLMESTVHPSVQFVSLYFSREAQKIDLSGVARSYKTVAEQVNILESNPQVGKVEFGGLSRDEKGLINFKLAIIFKPTLLQLNANR